MFSAEHERKLYPILAGGITDESVTPEMLQKRANAVFDSFQFVPGYATIVEEVLLCRPPDGDDFAVLLFNSEVTAEIFLDACSDQFQFIFEVGDKRLELRRNYEPTVSGSLRLPKIPSDGVIVVYISGLTADVNKLLVCFERILSQRLEQGNDRVKVLSAEGREAYVEFSSRKVAAELLNRCTKDAGLLTGFGDNLLMCRSSKCLPMLHSSRYKPAPQRMLDQTPRLQLASDIWYVDRPTGEIPRKVRPPAQATEARRANPPPVRPQAARTQSVRPQAIKVPPASRSAAAKVPPAARSPAAKVPLTGRSQAALAGSSQPSARTVSPRKTASGLRDSASPTNPQMQARSALDTHTRATNQSPKQPQAKQSSSTAPKQHPKPQNTQTSSRLQELSSQVRQVALFKVPASKSRRAEHVATLPEDASPGFASPERPRATSSSPERARELQLQVPHARLMSGSQERPSPKVQTAPNFARRPRTAATSALPGRFPSSNELSRRPSSSSSSPEAFPLTRGTRELLRRPSSSPRLSSSSPEAHPTHGTRHSGFPRPGSSTLESPPMSTSPKRPRNLRLPTAPVEGYASASPDDVRPASRSPNQPRTGTGGWIGDDEEDERPRRSGIKFVISKKRQNKLLPNNVLGN